MPSVFASSKALTDAQARSLSPGYASVLQSLAGRARYLCELVQGNGAVANANPGTSYNPQGLIGVDFSGPPFGSVWRHPVFWRGGVQADVSGDCVGQKQVGSVATSVPLSTTIEFHPRNFPAVPDTPYSRVYLAFRAFRTLGATFNLTITMGSEGSSITRSSTVSITSATETSFAPTNIYWDVISGQLNKLSLRFDVSTAASAVTISGFSGYQKEKRTH